ncbi:hypothetical protein O4J56_00840 [Nocardiopsis sp. RSe5-2]|uniref:Uncharacterized protein n=1 Tax=Nocardiopsis endophytica TaxID=3018445 RepID=A0ABT4TYG0_9ACTN|nr:hypothetical protein [Nocardiopsis endophytica]MDA2809172.1 hypothetical protein [Nocardiopsis endophytica]
MTDRPHPAGGADRPDRPQYPGGTEYPEAEALPGGYHLPEREAPRWRPAPEPADAGADEEAVAGTPFRRSTPARRKRIPELRGGGHLRLIAVTVFFVMATGSAADYIDPATRAFWHLLFWAGVGTAAAVTLARERRNGWEPGPRWVWPAAALGGTLLAELLIALLGSPVILVASVVVGALFLFIVMLFG